nr:MAG TPA: hypothetical protein [Caudoviricetes sp.]
MKYYKAKVRMPGKEYKQFIKGIDYIDDNKCYELVFYAKSLRDYFRFYWSIFRKHKATFTRYEKN